jgi:hypothetical protein
VCVCVLVEESLLCDYRWEVVEQYRRCYPIAVVASSCLGRMDGMTRASRYE